MNVVRWQWGQQQQLAANIADAVDKDGRQLFDNIMYGGALGGGKTVWLVRMCILRAIRYPGSRCLLCRALWSDFEGTTLITLKREAPESLLQGRITRSASYNSVLIRSSDPNKPSELVYGGVRGTAGGETNSKVLGSEFDWIAIDQAEELEEELFNDLSARAGRWLPETPHQILLSANPAPGFIKRRFVSNRQKRDAFIPALASDNTFLLEKDPHYIERISAGKSANWLRRMIEGDWSAFEGQIYEAFDPAVHVAKEHPTLSQHARYALALDWGLNRSATCVALLATETDGTRYVLDEIYRNGVTIEELDQLAVDKGFRPHELTCIADPATETGESDGQSVASKLRGKGWRIVTEGVNKRFEHRIPLCQSRLLTNPATGNPYTIWSPHCRNAIREMQERMYDKDKEKPTSGNDHFVDAWEYFETWVGAGRVPGEPMEDKPIDTRGMLTVMKPDKTRQRGFVKGYEEEQEPDRMYEKRNRIVSDVTVRGY